MIKKLSHSPALKILPWDTKFFKFSVSKIELDKTTPSSELPILLNSIHNKLLKKTTPPKLIYFFSNALKKSENKITTILLKLKYKNTFKETRVLFEKKTSLKIKKNKIKFYKINKSKLNKNILNLALTAGIHSRFKETPKVPAYIFKELYKKWIQNSLQGKDDAIVLSLTPAGHTHAGIICLTPKILHSKKMLEIDLIAVNPKEQGKGTGKLLIECADQYARKNKFSVLQVKTQKENLAACQFYKKCGFNVNSTTRILHFWR